MYRSPILKFLGLDKKVLRGRSVSGKYRIWYSNKTGRIKYDVNYLNYLSVWKTECLRAKRNKMKHFLCSRGLPSSCAHCNSFIPILHALRWNGTLQQLSQLLCQQYQFSLKRHLQPVFEACVTLNLECIMCVYI